MFFGSYNAKWSEALDNMLQITDMQREGLITTKESLCPNYFWPKTYIIDGWVLQWCSSYNLQNTTMATWPQHKTCGWKNPNGSESKTSSQMCEWLIFFRKQLIQNTLKAD